MSARKICSPLHGSRARRVWLRSTTLLLLQKSCANVAKLMPARKICNSPSSNSFSKHIFLALTVPYVRIWNYFDTRPWILDEATRTVTFSSGLVSCILPPVSCLLESWRPSRSLPMEQNMGLSLIHEADPSHSSVIPICDIVFVHGLGGHSRKTWTTPRSNTYWPRDFLPAGIPSARILTYGYDSSIASFATRISVSAVAESLLESLAEQRAPSQEVRLYCFSWNRKWLTPIWTEKSPIDFRCPQPGWAHCQESIGTLLP